MAALNFPDPNVQTSYTNPDTGITYEWANGIWKAVRTAQTAPELFVDADGDNLTGNLTLGTDKIVLNATDGSAEFADGNAVITDTGNIKAGPVDTSKGSTLSNTGQFGVRNDDADGTVRAISVYKGGQGGENALVDIRYDGNATFAGAIQTTATNNAFYASAGYSGGEAAIRVQNTNTGGNPYYLYCDSSDGNIAYIKTDGSASFAGDVTVENVPSPTIRIIGTGQGTALFGQGWDRSPGGNTGAVIAADNGPIVFRRGVAYNGDPGDTASGTTAMFIHQDTGNVYIGGDIDTDVTNRNIELKSDGSAEFAGTVNTGSWPNDASTSTGGGAYLARQDSSTSVVWKALSGGTGSSNVTSQIFANGAATFAGIVSTDGAYVVNSGSGVVGDVFLAKQGGTPTAFIQSNGSATFAGDITVSSTNADSNSATSSKLKFGLSNVSQTAYLQTSPGGSGGPGGFGGNLNFYVKGDASNPFVKALELNYLGNATFAGSVESENNFFVNATADDQVCFRAIRNGVNTALINGNGSATFAGGIAVSTTVGNGFTQFVNNANPNIKCFAAYNYDSASYPIDIRANGNATFAGNITAGNVSDIKFKENIEAAPTQLADIEAFELKTFDWKDQAPLSDELKAQRKLGLIAQEVEAICPEMVYEVTGQDDDSYKAINHDVLIMKLLGAVKELSAKVEALEAK